MLRCKFTGAANLPASCRDKCKLGSWRHGIATYRAPYVAATVAMITKMVPYGCPDGTHIGDHLVFLLGACRVPKYIIVTVFAFLPLVPASLLMRFVLLHSQMHAYAHGWRHAAMLHDIPAWYPPLPVFSLSPSSRMSRFFARYLAVL